MISEIRRKCRQSQATSVLTSADLFAGAGGLSVGFHCTGFQPMFFNELVPQFAETLMTNFFGAKVFVCPIETLTADIVRRESALDGHDLDVMVGGPPCQGFSINAPVRDHQDPRNHLFLHYVRLVLEGIRPKFVVLENVPGLVSLDGGETLEHVRLAFENAGYRVIYRVLNAAHYGVPQERWRLFFLGTRCPEVELSFPLPIHYSLSRANHAGGNSFTFKYAVGKPEGNDLLGNILCSPTTVGEAISDLPHIKSGGGAAVMDYTLPPQSAYQAELRQGSEKLYNHECCNLERINMERMQHVKPGGSWRDIPFDLLPAGLKRARRSDHTKRYGRLDPAGLSGTVLTKCDPHWGTYVHYNQDRVISVREAARIQSFPDWFRFTGAKIEQYKQVGNAVPPLLAKAIACHIANVLLPQISGN